MKGWWRLSHSATASAKWLGKPSVFLVESKEEAKLQAKTLTRSLGLGVYGFVDKTGASDAIRPG